MNDLNKMNSNMSSNENAGDIIDSKQQSFAQNVLYRHGTFLSNLFPDPKSKEAQKYQVGLIELEGKTAIELRRISGEYQKRALKEAVNAVLRKGGFVVTADTQEFAARIGIRLESTLRECQSEFGKLMDAMESELPKIKNKVLKARKEKYITDRVNNYYDMMDTFALEFKSQIANQIT